MDRRKILAAVAAVAALPPLARAQYETRPARIGWVTAQRPPSLVPYVQAFRAALAERGFAEGSNLTMHFRYGEDDLSRVPALTEELLRQPVDLIVAQGEAVLALRRMNLPVPVVYAYSGDPVTAGLATSLARPNATMTGLTFLATELNGKRLELIAELVPGVRRVALLANPQYPGEAAERGNAEVAARRLGIDARHYAARTPEELDAAFARMTADRTQGISLFADSFTVQNRAAIIGYAMRQKLPLVSSWPVFADSGALCTYGPRLVDSYQRLAYYADRVLRGTPPADLPVEQPTTIETIVNMKTAEALGLKVPPSVLVRADRVIG